MYSVVRRPRLIGSLAGLSDILKLKAQLAGSVLSIRSSDVRHSCGVQDSTSCFLINIRPPQKDEYWQKIHASGLPMLYEYISETKGCAREQCRSWTLNLQRAQKPDGRENVHDLRGHLWGGGCKRYCRHEVPGLRTRGDRLSTKLPSHAVPTSNAVYRLSIKELATNGTGSNGRTQYYFGICILAICGLSRVHLRLYTKCICYRIRITQWDP